MTLIEEYRKAVINDVLNGSVGFSTDFLTWRHAIHKFCPHLSANELFDLGDHLRDVFQTTNVHAANQQSNVASGGSAWERLVCWYLNLCNIGRRTIIIKHKKEFIPDCVLDAMTVNYGNFSSNSESDLIAITFPDMPEYNEEISNLNIKDSNGKPVNTFDKTGALNLKEIINILGERDFNNLEIHIIQCKTNWNDNAQIPMLWNMVYSAVRLPTNVTIGKNGYSIHSCSKFTYSFVTVPSNKLSNYKAKSTCVKRVENLTGGNYWGLPTSPNIAASIKEMLTRNLLSGNKTRHITTMSDNINRLKSDMSYFAL